MARGRVRRRACARGRGRAVKRRSPPAEYLRGRFDLVEADREQWTDWMRRQAGLSGPAGVDRELREYRYEMSGSGGERVTALACAPPDTFFWMVERCKAVSGAAYGFDRLLVFLRSAGIPVRRELGGRRPPRRP